MDSRERALRCAETHAQALIAALREADPNNWEEGIRLAVAITEAIREELAEVPVEYCRAAS